MKHILAIVFLVLLIGTGVLVFSSAFIVTETETAVVHRFNKVTRPAIKKSGLYWKLPFIETVLYFDKRLLDVEVKRKEMPVADKKQIVVDAFARYKIVDPRRNYQSLGEPNIANRLIIDRLESSMDTALGSVLGRAKFMDVVRDKREDLMHQIREIVGNEAKRYGVEIIDVRIKRADLPEKNSKEAFKRMKAEREWEAEKYRAEGRKKKKEIMADADRQVTIVKANAERDAERLRGEGDAERNRIFAEAYKKDPEFFAFYRSMQAYATGLKSNNTQFVISPDSEFFRYFNNEKSTSQPK
jgi:membrane protease subunit HflC